MAKQLAKVPISRRALIGRINRRLRGDDLCLKTTRGEGRARRELGEYYVINVRYGGIVWANVDLESEGREHGALRDWEELRED